MITYKGLEDQISVLGTEVAPKYIPNWSAPPGHAHLHTHRMYVTCMPHVYTSYPPWISPPGAMLSFTHTNYKSAIMDLTCMTHVKCVPRVVEFMPVEE